MARDQNAERKPTIEIVNGVPRLMRVSPSQLKTFNLCQLKWWFEKKKHYPKKPPGKGVITGLQAHGRMEHFLLTGDDVRGALERSGEEMIKPYLWAAPYNKGGGMVEAAVEKPNLRTGSGVEIVGFIDYVVPPSSNGPTTVIDHKFRKSIEDYAETGDEIENPEKAALWNDPQAIIYSFWAMHRWSVSRVRFEHHNYQTQGRRYGEARGVTFLAGALDFKWNELETRIKEIEACAEIEDELKVNHNEEACGAFGGCDFAKVCPHSPLNRFLNDVIPPTNGESKMGLLDGMNAALSAQTAATAPANPASLGAAASPPAVGGLKFRTQPASDCIEGRPYRLADGRKVEFQAKTATHAFLATADGAPVRLALTDTVEDLAAPLPPEKERKLGIVDCDAQGNPLPKTGGAVGVVPPDAPPTAPTTPASAILNQNAATLPAAPLAANTPVSTSTAPAAGAEAESETKKRGRKKSEGAGPTDFAGLVLCVDCCPSKPHADLSAWVADLASGLALAGKVEEIRFAPKDHPFAYSGWKGAISKKALENAPTGLCVIYRSELTEPVIEALAGVASVVIRG